MLVSHPAVADAAVIGRPDEAAARSRSRSSSRPRRSTRRSCSRWARRARRALQAAARRALRRRDPAHAVGQGAAARPPRAGACHGWLMPKRSAGILLHRDGPDGREVLLVHPGGPFWAKRDDGAWSIPKGEYDDGEDPLAAARREFEEELGSPLPDGAELRDARRGPPEEPQGRRRLGGRGRPRRVGGAVEHVRDGVAAAVRAAAGVPRDRSRRVVPARAGAREAAAGAGGVPGPAGRGAAPARRRGRGSARPW